MAPDRQRSDHAGVCAEDDIVAQDNVALVLIADAVSANKDQVLADNRSAGNDDTKCGVKNAQSTSDIGAIVDGCGSSATAET